MLLIPVHHRTRAAGALYMAQGRGKANFFFSVIRHNRDHCNRRTMGNDDPGSVPRYALGGGAAAPQLAAGAGAAGAGAQVAGPGGGGGPPRRQGAVDVSGAVAQGPPLTDVDGGPLPDDARRRDRVGLPRPA